MIEISFIIPVYNAEKYIKRCLDSILEYKEKNIEIIVIDDGSKDKSSEIIKEYANIDARIIYIQKTNTGVSNTRNVGLEKARGKYIVFIDADDYIEKNSIQKLIKNIQEDVDLYIMPYKEENNASIKIEDYSFLPQKKYITLEEIQKLIPHLIGNVDDEGNRISNIMGSIWSKVFKREIIQKNNIRMVEEIEITEDLCFLLEYLLCCYSVEFSDLCFYHYTTVSNNSITRRYKNNLYGQLEKGLDYIEQLLENKKIKFKNVIRYKRYYNIYASIVNECASEESVIQKRKDILKLRKKIEKTKKVLGLSRKEKIIYYLLKMKCIIPVILYYSKKKEKSSK